MRSLVPLQIDPGIYTEDSELEVGRFARWSDGNRVRFWKGKPQPIGGWQRASGNTLFEGIVRSMLIWVSLLDITYLALGSHTRLYIWRGGAYSNVTPLSSSGQLEDPFSVTIDSATVTVAHASHGRIAGSSVIFEGADELGGITIDGAYTVVGVPNADHYTIVHSAAASFTESGGGTVDYDYEIAPGSRDATFGLGWGVGLYGRGTYGTPRAAGAIQTNVPRFWSLDTYGEDLIANAFRGPIYRWDTSTGTGTRATLLADAPSTARCVLTSDEARHLIAFGAHDGAADDPMNIRWCSTEDLTEWTPGSLNTAGSKRLDGGSEILQAVKASREIVVLTDAGMHTMRFIGGSERFAFDTPGRNCGVIGPRGCAVHDGLPIWMGPDRFFIYTGRVEEIPCDMHKDVFDNLNTTQAAKVFAGVNLRFGEVTWFYPSASSTEIDAYVSYSVRDRTWAKGMLDRTAWIDDKRLPLPLGAAPNGVLYQHEIGRTADSGDIGAWIESGYGQMGAGSNTFLLRALVPDWDDIEGAIAITLSGKRDPQGAEETKGPFTCAPGTTRIKPRLKARQQKLRVETSGAGSYFRLGGLRVDLRQTGGR